LGIVDAILQASAFIVAANTPTPAFCRRHARACHGVDDPRPRTRFFHQRFVLAKNLNARLFAAVRFVNRYGDPQPWVAQGDTAHRVMSFVNCTKYPASLAYVLMTLGPALLILAWASNRHEGKASCWVFPLNRLGRVPLFYYVLHVFVIHIAAWLVAWFHRGWVSPELWGGSGGFASIPAAEGNGLPMVYAVTAGVVFSLYPACIWFDVWKQKTKAPGSKYL